MARGVDATYGSSMKVERLFNVLVLQGALLAGACDEEPEPDDATTGTTAAEPGSEAETSEPEPGSSGGTDGGSTGEVPSTESSAGSSGEMGSTGDGTAGVDDSTGEPLVCSDPPDPTDPCGCPCCWVFDGCLNTEQCCEGWSECVGR